MTAQIYITSYTIIQISEETKIGSKEVMRL